MSAARCIHFGDCGGCRSQDVPYADQVVAKQEALQVLLADAWSDAIPVVPSPVVWHYRNKIDPAFAPKQYEERPPKDFVRETVLGYKRTGRWYWPLDIEECLIAPDGMRPLFAALRDWYRAKDLRAYNNKTGEGTLRNLLVREGKRTGERMVVIITTSDAPSLDGFVEAVQGAWPAHSIQHGTCDSRADIAMAENLRVLHGAAHIHDELHLGGLHEARVLRFRISPMSFFQTNTIATEGLYSAVRAWVGEVAPRVLYDLYGGMGGIAFSCSDLVERVESVENVEAATLDGRANAAANGIDNVNFTTAAVEHYLRDLRDGAGLAEGAAVVIDPPRSGMNPKAVRRLMELAPRDILYVSCNPKIFAQEWKVFSEGYTLTEVHGFDLFPHTPHVELVAAMTRKG